MKKGQNFRVFVDGLCIAAAKSCSLEETAELEDISTKDSTGKAKENSVKGKSWNGSADALVLNEFDETAKTILPLLNAIVVGEPVAIKFCETSGDMNRTAKTDSEVTYTGFAIINDLTLKATVNEEISLSVKFMGYGPLNQTSTEG